MRFDYLRHIGSERHFPHVHAQAFAAVLIEGGYVEAGENGRHLVASGDILFHSAYELHRCDVGLRGALVLVLPISPFFGSGRGHSSQLQDVIHCARTDAIEAGRLLEATSSFEARRKEDWTDALAADLKDDPSESLEDWARQHGIRPQSVSRGFKRRFGITPKAFALRARTRHALRRITQSNDELSAVAYESGFADHAHMTRSVVRMTGLRPVEWRKVSMAQRSDSEAYRHF